MHVSDGLTRLLAVVVPVVAVALFQLCQCDNHGTNWRSDVSVPYRPSNISSRDFSVLPAAIEDAKGPTNVVAYHRSLHNTSWAITIPLFSFLLPITSTGDPLNIANQAIYGVFAAIIVIIGFGIPILFNGNIPDARSLDNNHLTLSHLMHPGHMVNMVGANFQNQLGIDPMQCLQKTVCESHRSPQNKRYGILAKPFQYFFPASKKPEEYSRSIYKDAARVGKYTKTDCRKKYECMFDILELMTYLLSAYQKAQEKVSEQKVQEAGSNSL